MDSDLNSFLTASGGLIKEISTSSFDKKLLQKVSFFKNTSNFIVRNNRTKVPVQYEKNVSEPLKRSFHLLQTWIGYVIAVNDGEFVAVIKDKTNPSAPDEEVTISIDELSPPDQDALEIGAEFFWTIGREKSPAGTVSRVSDIRLRRLVGFRDAEVQYAQLKAKEISDLVGSLMDD
ncbi:hypothetical protein CLH62_14270 [Marinobacter guineae]|uniref:Uncharacterized protein n=2 Tax=Marinobacter guineae TaxID=432303 RepID=A0A2G1VFG6_9GAMM|nr:hypothetical protein CLH62_14270 [Marinobacter guineae]